MKFQQSMTLQNNNSHGLTTSNCLAASHGLVNGHGLTNSHGLVNGHGLTNSHNINNYEDITITLNINYYDAYNGASKPVTIERKLIINNVISHEMETLYIVITKGIDTNEMIILQNKGNIYINNATTNYSNIKIIIVLTKHEYFERNGLDLCFLKTITLKEALSGFAFSLAHINNKHYNIVSNEIIDFKYEKIIPNLGFIRDSYVGNLIIKFNIIFPKIISQENKALLQTLL
jgi:DnaJ-class molecular chaperone